MSCLKLIFVMEALVKNPDRYDHPTKLILATHAVDCRECWEAYKKARPEGKA